MTEIRCLDSNGNEVEYLTQWDTGQTLMVKNTGLTVAPMFHFFNQRCREAYVVSSTISGGIISVNIPNELLQDGLTITACIFVYSSLTEGKTDAMIRIPVRPRPKPSDYKYVENIDVVSVLEFKKEISGTLKELGILKTDLTQKADKITVLIDELETCKTSINEKIPLSQKGTANGVAELDANGTVPSSQLPSYTDDVIEGYYYMGYFYSDSDYHNEVQGESGKLYLDLWESRLYRWVAGAEAGAQFREVSRGLALGETSSTAYAGDKGKANADDISALKSGKVDKIDGKGLSTNDFTTEYKEKLDGLDSNISEAVALKADASTVLAKNNTAEFAPTGDYNPATKKYVDDLVADKGSGDMLRNVYDQDKTGVVDDAEKLGGRLPSYYTDCSNITQADGDYIILDSGSATENI